MYYVAQAVGVCAVLLFTLSYQQKTRKGIVACNTASRVLYVLQYVLLSAFEGAVLDIVGVVAAVVAGRKDTPFIKRHRLLFFLGSNVVIVATGLLMYRNVFSLLPMMGVMLQIGAFWLDKEKHIRWVALLSCPFWLTYNLYSAAYGSVIGDALTIGSILIALFRYRRPKTE